MTIQHGNIFMLSPVIILVRSGEMNQLLFKKHNLKKCFFFFFLKLEFLDRKIIQSTEKAGR